ncbi:MAG: DNA primase [Pseudomonadales bacterium]
MIPQEFIEELLARTDIVEVVESRVALKKTGQNYSGLCPFHSEKTPSFTVSPDKQFYYCFGCQASGSALKFVMEFDRLDFVAAVESLADKVGLEVPRTQGKGAAEQRERRKSIYEVLEQAAEFYKSRLKSHQHRDRAVEYLKGRGLSGEIARDFALGYAPPEWDGLYSALAKTNHERDLLIASGMVIEKPEEEKIYDRFRDRVMFPIRDLRGRVIAFGGRLLGDGQPKYLNSPETDVFHKGRELYGLFEARRRNHKLERLLVVEGYMDVVALAQYGISYAVATLGTATSREHMERMYRLVSSLAFCFDGDEAGRNAAWKALQTSLPLMQDGRSARFLFLPEGEDPDSLIRQEGKDKFEYRLQESPHLPDFFFDKLRSEVDMDSLEGKAALSKAAVPLINTIPDGVFKQLMIDRLSDHTGLSRDRLLEVMGNDNTSQRPGPARRREQEVSAGTSRTSLAEAALALILRQPELAGQFDEEVYGRLGQLPECRLLVEVIRLIRSEGLDSPAFVMARYENHGDSGTLKTLAEQEALLDVSELPDEFSGIINALTRKLEVQSIQELRRDLLKKPFAELSTSERQMLREITRGTYAPGKQE